MADEIDNEAGFHIIGETLEGASMRVVALGSGNTDPVDREDVALTALDSFEGALTHAGEQTGRPVSFDSPVTMRTPGGGFRVIRGGRDDDSDEPSRNESPTDDGAPWFGLW